MAAMLLSSCGLNQLLEAKVRVRGLIGLVLVVLALSALPAAAAPIPILSLTPSVPLVNVGETFTLNIEIADITNLYGFGFDLNYDASLVSVVPSGPFVEDVVEGPFLPTGGATFFISGFNNGIGTIVSTLDALLLNVSGVSGSGILASVLFKAEAAGASPFSLSNIQLQSGPPTFLTSDGAPCIDGEEDCFLRPTQIPLTSVELNTSASVDTVGGQAVVPEPSTMILLASGLVLAARRRFSRARHQA